MPDKRAKIKYKVDTRCDGNFIPLYIFKVLSPKAPLEQLAKQR